MDGYDEITPVILKFCKGYMVYPLTFLVNSSIKEGNFLNSLKLGVVRLIHKKVSKEENGVIDITLRPVFGEIFEKLLTCRLPEFLDKGNIFNKSQYDFRRSLSVTTAIANFLHELMLKS